MARNDPANTEHTSAIAHADAGDTISAHHLSPHEGTSTSHKHGKFCCACGKDVAGQTRFKDKMGRYWCLECGNADEMKKRVMPCADCHQAFQEIDTVEFEGVHLCQDCYAKRKAAAKRAAARLAAAEAEAARVRAHRRMMVILVSVLAALAAACAAVRYVLY